MSEDFLEFHRQSLDAVTCLVGDEFTYNGIVYVGVISALELSTQLKEGGLEEVLGTQIVVSKCKLPAAPIAGETLYIGTQKARIIRVASDEVSYDLTCVSAAH